MIYKEEIVDIVQETLFANFAFPPSVMDKYVIGLSNINNIEGLVDVINALAIEYRKDKFNPKPPLNLIIDTYNKKVMSRLRNNTTCNLCNNKGTIIAFCDLRDGLIEWKKGIHAYQNLTQAVLVCECEYGNDMIKFPQKSVDQTVCIRSKLIEKYGLTYRDAKRVKLINIAIDEYNKQCDNIIDSLDSEMVLFWFTRFFIKQCRNYEGQ